MVTPNRQIAVAEAPFRGKETFILRTRSADEGGGLHHAIMADEENRKELGGSLPVASLHSSFDAALLGSSREDEDDDGEGDHHLHTDEAIFRSSSLPRVSLAGASSWDEPESARKSHFRNVNNPTNAAEVSVRKTRYSSSLPSNSTPGRPLRPPAVPQSTTPGSSSRRRKAAPMHHRKCKSPFHQTRGGVPSSAPRPPREQTPTSSLKNAPYGDSTGTPFQSTPAPYPPKYKSGLHTGNYTASTATVNSSLDFTIDTPSNTDQSGSHESPGVTFRFTSFPASLPRVNPRSPYCPNTATKNNQYPSSHKKLSYSSSKTHAEPASPAAQDTSSHSSVSEHATALKRARPMMNVMRMHSQLPTEDGSPVQHNSSLSSMSGEQQQQAGNMMMHSNPSFPPPLDTITSGCDVLEWWKSPQHDALAKRGNGLFDNGSKYGNSEDSGDLMLEPRQTVAPKTNTKLFLDANYSDSDEEESPLRPSVPRTRLNFNLVTSPNGAAPQQTSPLGSKQLHHDNAVAPSNVDLSKPFVTDRRVNSCASTSSSMDDQATLSTATGTTGSPVRTAVSDNPFRAASPTEMQFRFRLDEAECSPILPPYETICTKDSMDLGENASPSERPLSPVAELAGAAVCAANNQSADDSTNRLSLSQESSESSSSSTSSKQRRLRPMPDMSAFEAGGGGGGGASFRSAVSRLSSEDNSNTSITAPPSPKLTCPPTPVRTPAWAHTENTTTHPFARANSLNVTKVLATCPIQVVDGHSSLENSTMEEDSVGGDGEGEKRRASLSFSTVDEEMEEVEDQEQHASADSMTPPTRGPPRLPTGQPLRELSMNPTTPFAARVYSSKPASSKPCNDETTISFATSFHNLGKLGSGAFADVYKVRSKTDCQLYAVKRNRRQFRGKRDRDMAMAEVRTMQSLQSTKQKSVYSLYVLFFYRAWQEEGYFYCQTELCCRDTCRQLMESLRSNWPSAVTKYPSLNRHLGDQKASHLDEGTIGRLAPDATVWKICHDVVAGLSHIHAHGIVHHDIKPSNIFFVSHARLGAMCKIGDFGMAGDVGKGDDGQEGDTVYMPPELLSSSIKHTSADIFSFGLTLYELAAAIGWELPVEGPLWHELRGGSHVPELPSSRHADLTKLIQATISADRTKRPSADDILNHFHLVKAAGSRCDDFLKDYLLDVATNDRIQELEERADSVQTPRHMEQRELRTPTPDVPLAPLLYTPNAHS